MTFMNPRSITPYQPANLDWQLIIMTVCAVLFVAYPIVVGLLLIDGTSLTRLFSTQTLPPLLNSAILAMGTVLPCIAIGVPLAWLCARSDLPWRGFITALVSISFVTPILLIAIAYVFLLGRNAGLINVFWAELFDEPLYDVYSFSGVIFVSILHGYPLIFFTTLSGLTRMNPELEEAGRVCGLSALQVFFRVTLSAVLPSIMAGIAFCFAESVTMLAAPLVLGLPVGIRFMTTDIYGAIVTSPNLPMAAAMSLPLILGTVAALWLQSRLLGGGTSRRFAVLGGKGGRGHTVSLGLWRWPAFSFALLPIVLSLILPVLTLLTAALMDKWWRGFEPDNFTLANFKYLFADDVTAGAIVNSTLLSVGVAGSMALIGGVGAILISGDQDRLKRGVRWLCELPLGLPHVVAGIVVILAWYGKPFNLGGTLWLLAFGYILVMLPYAMKTCEAAFNQIDISLSEAAHSVGCSRAQAWRYVLLPLMRNGMVTTFMIVFLFVIKEFSLTAMVYSASTQTLAVRVYTFLDGGSYEKTAAASIALLALTFGCMAVASKIFQITITDLKV